MLACGSVPATHQYQSVGVTIFIKWREVKLGKNSSVKRAFLLTFVSKKALILLSVVPPNKTRDDLYGCFLFLQVALLQGI